ncbi:MAG: hypothetical protein ACTSO9_01435 [Candidatus Helarchaeota archaeon]
MSLASTFKEAAESLNDLLYVESLVVFNGSELKYSNIKENINMEKVRNALFAAIENIGFDIGLQELEIINNSNSIKIYLNKNQMVIIKIQSKSSINDSLLKEKVSVVFNFINK